MLLRTTLAIALVAGVLGIPAAAPPPSIAWTPCARDATAQCGTLSVPADWRRPKGPRIDVAVARRLATDRSGPGRFAGVRSGRSRGLRRRPDPVGIDRFSPELRRRFDIVSFDPRGVGQSTPASCPPGLSATRPAPILADQADFEATVRFNRICTPLPAADRRTARPLRHALGRTRPRRAAGGPGRTEAHVPRQFVRHAARRDVRRAVPAAGARDRVGERDGPQRRHARVPGATGPCGAGRVHGVRRRGARSHRNARCTATTYVPCGGSARPRPTR